MYQDKMTKYEAHLPELTRRGIRYKPMILSCFGRWHPDSLLTMEAITKQASCKCGFADHRLLFQRALASIGVLIWRRAAAMVRSCLPRATDEELQLVLGQDPGVEDSNSILTPIVAADGPNYLKA